MSRAAGEELAGDSDKYPKPGNLEQGIYALAEKELKEAQHGEDVMAELLAAYRDAQRMQHAEYSNAHIELETLTAKSANAAADASMLYQKDRRLRLEIMNLLTQQSIAKSSVVNTEIAVAGDLAEIGDLASSHGDAVFSEKQKAALAKSGISAPVVKDTEKAVLALAKSEKGVAAAGSKKPLPKTEDLVLNHLDGKAASSKPLDTAAAGSKKPLPKTEDVVLNHLDSKTANSKPLNTATAVKQQPKEAPKEAAKKAKKEAAKEVQAEAPKQSRKPRTRLHRLLTRAQEGRWTFSRSGRETLVRVASKGRCSCSLMGPPRRYSLPRLTQLGVHRLRLSMAECTARRQ
jgi:hypothetical protein